MSFARPWSEYVQGFGDVLGEYWIGLQHVYRLTKQGSEIYFDMEMGEDIHNFAHYKNFTVHSSLTDFRLQVNTTGYNGSIEESLSHNHGMKFSTFDRDNDQSEENCSKQRSGSAGWWFNKCSYGNVNGSYVKRETGGLAHWYYGVLSFKSVTIKVKSMLGSCCK